MCFGYLPLIENHEMPKRKFQNDDIGGRYTRVKLTAGRRNVIASEQGWSCASCHEKLSHSFHVDHIVPLFVGGNNDNDNLQALCANCHCDKSHMEQVAYHEAQQKYGHRGHATVIKKLRKTLHTKVDNNAAEEYVVSSIVGHRVVGSNLEFHVKWRDSDVTWEPYQNVYDCAAFETYVVSHLIARR